MNKRTKEAFNDLVANLDCGDNFCPYSKTLGMRTNGGCRCFKDLSSKISFYLRRLLISLEEEINE